MTILILATTCLCLGIAQLLVWRRIFWLENRVLDLENPI